MAKPYNRPRAAGRPSAQAQPYESADLSLSLHRMIYLFLLSGKAAGRPRIVTPSPIGLQPNTTYSFTAFSNGESLDESPIWLEGAKAFTTTNDPNTDVRLAYTYYPGKEWWPRHLRDGRKVPSLQVYTS
ncbi:hypothetical protein DYB37_013208 [Aphanomyces astaci]|uniref:Uncharacterized protein n=1 Tax=Aphanomyces astaci TaxID=112090 RepID=A0A418FHD1_APHAT|nr:hypothetical protein DYB37_013208 [Aphanomyces astaci]